MKTRIQNVLFWTSIQFFLAASSTLTSSAQSPTADDFNPGLGGSYVSISCLAVQGDGKILLGGWFATVAEQARTNLCRLNTDGSLDASFNPGTSGWVSSMAVQADGKILVGGDFTTLGGQPRTNIGRLNSDGTLDTNFNPGASSYFTYAYVSSLAVQADGKILVGGQFPTLGGQPRDNIGRLNSDGTLDTNFNPGADNRVNSLAVQADGKILVGGYFTTLGRQARNNIGRLNSDGTLDTTFNPGAGGYEVYSLAVQADGKILVGGSFTTLDGQPRNNIGQLNSDGTLDTTFNPEANDSVYSFAVQTDGKILVGGRFTTLGGQAHTNIGRLNTDGSVDDTFNPEANNYVYSLAVQADGKILVGGRITTLGGQARSGIGRLNNTDPATQNLSYAGSTITWLRGGTSPEVWRTAFDASTNGGADWVQLGEGTRISGGWRLTGVSVASNANIRARGRFTGGVYNGSSWFVESIIGPVLVLGQPQSRSNNAGTVAKFNVVVGGTSPSYQWLKDGVVLSEGGHISGVQTATLTLSNVLGGDAGGYSVIVSNAFGSVTSQVATLTVNDPYISVQPVSRNLNPGSTAQFSVTAVGTAPMAYQWRQNGAAVAGATAATLTLTNVQRAEAGNYDVVVSNTFGSVTSQVAMLTVNLTTVDLGFDPRPDYYAYVNCLAVQADGKILVGGDFTTLGGQARSRIGRLNADGSLDTIFNPGTDNWVSSLAVQPDGKILVGGRFTTLGGQPRNYLGRLNPDGSLDTNFNPGADYNVSSLALQADGKILVGGEFTTLGGQARSYLGRLNTDGSLDTTFNPGASGGNFPSVSHLAVQADGKILVGGFFTTLGGQARTNFGRLNPNGSLDTTFNPGTGPSSWAYVSAFAVQAEGKILVGGQFTTLGGQARDYLARLNADGSLDTTFEPATDVPVSSLAVQADGKILVGGSFSTLNGQPRSSIGRLNADGSLDATFSPEVGGSYPYVGFLAVQADGKILVGGSFTSLGGQSRLHIGRLNNTDPATQDLSYDGSTITWLRGGTSPEAWRTSFESSTNAGADWIPLGEGTRINGGWELTSVGAATNANIRARGFVSGSDDSSRWFVESIIGPAVMVAQPVSRTNDAGTTATFGAVGGGTSPLSYQWWKGGVLLSDNGNVLGSQTPTLTLSNVFGGDAGGYWVVVSNAFGSVTSQVATLTVIEPIVNSHPLSQLVHAGDTAALSVMTTGTEPLGYQWFKDGATVEDGGNVSGSQTATLTLSSVAGGDAGGYWVVVSNAYGRATSAVAQLTVNLASLDQDFNPGANGSVYAFAEQPDGKILVGGSFTTLGGEACTNLGRLNLDGSLDSTFNPGASSSVYSLAVQADGKILVGGSFTTLGGQARERIARLNADGSLDTTFNPGASSTVYSLAVQADGKILVGGVFTTLGGQARERIARLNTDGSLDTTFNPGASSTVYSLAVQADGKILVGGYFTTLGGQSRSRIGRLNADGSVDTAFNPGASSYVYSLAMQADGKILVGGYFTTLGGQSRSRIGRLNADGSVDTTFNPGANNYVYSLAVQADGKILLGGYFTALGGETRSYLGRLNADGGLDSTFNPGASSYVYSLAVQAEGKILVGGSFSTLAGQARSRIGRLNNTDPATQNLSYDGSAITWLRGGTSPEVWRTSFETSTNAGADWMQLGEGTRMNGGWELADVSVASTANVRARGFLSGGYFNGSSWFVESIIGPILMVSQPVSRTNNAGTVARFNVRVGGTPPLSYQWWKGGALLSDTGDVLGSHTSTLTLSNVLGGDAGGYWVVVSNAFGGVTSQVATLTVMDPIITSQPVGGEFNVGDSGAFNVAVLGTTPLAYQWRHDGVAVAGATAASLTFANVQGADAGDYDVVVSNAFGTATSLVAQLTVNLATVDLGFDPGASGTVYAFAGQADGMILVGGSFTTLAGQSRTNLGRLNSDGTLDPTFDPGASSSVLSLAVQGDGKILVGGSFTTLAGQSRTSLGRLNTDGSLDTTFNPGASGSVLSLALQADGKILVGGSFTTLGDQARNRIGRLNTDGSLDTTFNPGASSTVYSLAVQADGKILVGGSFTTLGGQSRSRVGRLNPDGSLDTTFNPGASSTVVSLAVQADGKILLGGVFASLDGQSRSRIGRLNPDGTVDTNFDPGTGGSRFSRVSSLAVQADGKILVGGLFASVGGQPRANIGRLNSDGSPDSSFNPGASGIVSALAPQADGKILAGGSFTLLAGQPRNRIGRLNNTGPATQSLSYNGSNITWLRGGTSPEVWRTSFETSANGVDWFVLGQGARINGGWQMANIFVPGNSKIRARGFLTGGQYNGSTWFVESIITLPPPTPAELVEHVITLVNGSALRQKQPLLATLNAALASILRDNCHSAVGQLGAFQNKVQAQVTDLVLASELIEGAGQVIAALNCDGSIHVAPRIRSLKRQANRRLQLQIEGAAGQVYLIQASSNLVDWQTIDTITLSADGVFEFEDAEADKHPCRFYRLLDRDDAGALTKP